MVFLTIVVGKVSLSFRGCVASQLSISSISRKVALEILSILVSQARLVSVSPLDIRVIHVSFRSTYFYYL